MVSHVSTIAFQGLNAIDVDVQSMITNGLPAFSIVGLPDKAVAESKERVRSSLYSMGLSLPPKRITINLSPADLQKEGSHYDLPIALGLLVGLKVLSQEEVSEFIAFGELGLDGRITAVSGALIAAVHANSLNRGIICSEASGPEAAWAGDMSIIAARTLLDLVNHFKGTQVLASPQPKLTDYQETEKILSDIRGQSLAKRALEIAAAGSHHLLMIGPPGAGKTMLAQRLPSLLPPLEAEEALEVSMVHSLCGQLTQGSIVHRRPFRAPHHSASHVSLVGGGHRAIPGEITLAHHGVLFLDEMPEFSRNSLESLRQPLEDKIITVARANHHVTYPAKFQLVAAMNPCRCGFAHDASRACRRIPQCINDYLLKISGPFMDRIDLCVSVPEVKFQDLKAAPSSPSDLLEIKARILQARLLQKNRYQHFPKMSQTNADVPLKFLEEITPLSTEGTALLQKASHELKLSARSYHRLLRVARTIADLNADSTLGYEHLAEAIFLKSQGYFSSQSF